MLDTKNSSTTYVVMYKLITQWFVDWKRRMQVLITPMALAHPLHPNKTGRGISAETCGLENVFPPDDLSSGPCTSFIIYISYIIAEILVIKIDSFKDAYIPKVGVAVLVCWVI